ncbi:UNVERIFIED_CONTAM: hypothetical protein Sangu_0229000 [Sesamum angustifolium]|uniref:CASP-like protein n=1 Tax=Sesamum angustifolium TaxID=2727405 RepID=A0AAW2RN99_9LAMI
MRATCSEVGNWGNRRAGRETIGAGYDINCRDCMDRSPPWSTPVPPSAASPPNFSVYRLFRSISTAMDSESPSSRSRIASWKNSMKLKSVLIFASIGSALAAKFSAVGIVAGASETAPWSPSSRSPSSPSSAIAAGAWLGLGLVCAIDVVCVKEQREFSVIVIFF